MHPTVAFCLPLAYSLHTRLLSRWQRIAWVFTYVVPAGGMYVLAGGGSPLAFALCVLLTYTRYEVGYIVNDAILTGREPEPTHRLTPRFVSWYLSHRTAVHAARWLVTIVLLVALYAIHGSATTLQYAAAALAITLVFVLYNRVRSRWTIPLYTLLVTLRYALPALPYLDGAAQWTALFLCFPALSTFEFCGKPRFRLGWARHNLRDLDRNRVIYYAVLTVALAVAQRWIPALADWHLLAVYFLAYRAATLALSAKFRAS